MSLRKQKTKCISRILRVNKSFLTKLLSCTSWKAGYWKWCQFYDLIHFRTFRPILNRLLNRDFILLVWFVWLWIFCTKVSIFSNLPFFFNLVNSFCKRAVQNPNTLDVSKQQSQIEPPRWLLVQPLFYGYNFWAKIWLSYVLVPQSST